MRFRSPMLISPRVPIAPSQKSDSPVSVCQIRQSDSLDSEDPKQGIPVIITWNYGGKDVLVEGSWDNWISRKRMQRSGKDYSILLALPTGIYHYKFIVDGEYRYVPELPHISDDSGHICNLLDVDDYVPEHPGSIAEFEAPPSPESGYSQVLWAGEDFAKEPLVGPPPLSASLNSPWSCECGGARSFQAPAHGAQPPLLREREILTIRGCHGIDPQVRVQVFHRGPL